MKDSLQYDGRPVGRFGVWVWNLGSLRREGEDGEDLIKKLIGVCCLQEMSWRGQGARMHFGCLRMTWWCGSNGEGRAV